MRQGYIFILCSEILANSIRKDILIKGIKVKVTEWKISPYADDTTLFLDESKRSLQESLNTLDRFGKISGLRVNKRLLHSLTRAMSFKPHLHEQFFLDKFTLTRKNCSCRWRIVGKFSLSRKIWHASFSLTRKNCQV